MKGTDLAPAGTVWVCAACGRTASVRYDFCDVSCSMHAVLCHERTDEGAPWRAVETQHAWKLVRKVLVWTFGAEEV